MPPMRCGFRLHRVDRGGAPEVRPLQSHPAICPQDATPLPLPKGAEPAQAAPLPCLGTLGVRFGDPFGLHLDGGVGRIPVALPDPLASIRELAALRPGELNGYR